MSYQTAKNFRCRVGGSHHSGKVIVKAKMT